MRNDWETIVFSIVSHLRDSSWREDSAANGGIHFRTHPFSLFPVFGGEGRGARLTFDKRVQVNVRPHPAFGHPLPQSGRGFRSGNPDIFGIFGRIETGGLIGVASLGHSPYELIRVVFSPHGECET